jgi:hypothetical protein
MGNVQTEYLAGAVAVAACAAQHALEVHRPTDMQFEQPAGRVFAAGAELDAANLDLKTLTRRLRPECSEMDSRLKTFNTGWVTNPLETAMRYLVPATEVHKRRSISSNLPACPLGRRRSSYRAASARCSRSEGSSPPSGGRSFMVRQEENMWSTTEQ